MRVVIPAVDYADMLEATLPAWRALFRAADLIVVTAKHDRATFAVARAGGADLLVTDAWTRDGAQFNKARALDEAFLFEQREPGELCIAIDADVYPFGTFDPAAIAAADVLYSVDRFYIDTPATLARQAAKPALDMLDRMTAGRRGPGYFQAFRARPDLTFGSYPDAGYYDLEFHRHFPGGVAVLEGFAVGHLGRKSGKNWRGRTLPKWGAA